jgi:hypothetical protein
VSRALDAEIKDDAKMEEEPAIKDDVKMEEESAVVLKPEVDAKVEKEPAIVLKPKGDGVAVAKPASALPVVLKPKQGVKSAYQIVNEQRGK